MTTTWFSPASSRAPATRTRRATSSGTGSGPSTRSTATGRRRSCCCRPGRSSTRGSGRRRSRICRATSGSSRSTAAATAAPTVRRESRHTTRRSSPSTPSPSWTDRHRERVTGRALPRSALGDDARRRAARAGVARHLPRAVGPAFPGHEQRAIRKRFEEPLDDHTGWAKYNRHYWQSGPEQYLDFLEFFFSQMFNEPHSTKQIEDGVGWGLEIDPFTLADTSTAAALWERERFREFAERVACPSLVIHGDNDMICPHSDGAQLAEIIGGEFVTIEGGGRRPRSRSGADQPPAPRLQRRRRRAAADAQLGAREVPHGGRSTSARRSASATPGATWRSRASCAGSCPDLEIDWLAQDPVTRVLEAEGERIHPASAELANESGHIESESAEHDLHAFQAIRRMDEILCANYMVFDDLVTDQAYDLVDRRRGLGDRLLPAREPGAQAGALRLAHRFRRLAPDAGRRRAGGLPDRRLQRRDDRADRALPPGPRPGPLRRRPRGRRPETSAPTCPRSAPGPRSTSSSRATSAASIRPSSPTARSCGRARLRAGRAVCIVTVGGSGVGEALLRRVIEAFPIAKSLSPSCG